MVTGLALAGCGGDDQAAGAPTTLRIVGFAVPEAANRAIAAQWTKTEAGKGVTFKQSYGASGDQGRAVVSGLEADYVHFSLEGDVTRLVQAGLVEPTGTGPKKGIVSHSVVVLATRKGNPKHITGWDDLVKPGVSIVTPNPGSSGSASWNILAAYGHVVANGGTDAQATTTSSVLRQRRLAARQRSRRHHGVPLGTGDVLISYENEAILARQQDPDIDYFVPDTTILIENPGAVTDADPRRRRGSTSVGQGQRSSSRRASARSATSPASPSRVPTTRTALPRAAEAADDRRRLRRLGGADQEVLRRQPRHRHSWSGLRKGADRHRDTPAAAGGARADRPGAASRCPGVRARARRRRPLVQPARADPARRGAGQGVAGGWGGFWRRDQRRRRARRAPAHGLASRSRHRCSTWSWAR